MPLPWTITTFCHAPIVISEFEAPIFTFLLRGFAFCVYLRQRTVRGAGTSVTPGLLQMLEQSDSPSFVVSLNFKNQPDKAAAAPFQCSSKRDGYPSGVAHEQILRERMCCITNDSLCTACDLNGPCLTVSFVITSKRWPLMAFMLQLSEALAPRCSHRSACLC